MTERIFSGCDYNGSGYLSALWDDYGMAHDGAAESDPSHWHTYCRIGQELEAVWYRVSRGAYQFETGPYIPADATILSAVIELTLYLDQSDTEFTIHVVNGDDLEDSLEDTDYNDLLDDTTSYGSIASTAVGAGFNAITLSADFYSKIAKGSGITKMAFRSSRDIDSTEPTGDEEIWFTVSTGFRFTVTYAADPPTVTTQAVSAITGTTAIGNGNITDLGDANPTAHGVCYNTTGSPTTGDDTTDEGAATATGAFTTSMTGLSLGTVYYVKAYATNTFGTSYGSEVTFTTYAHEYPTDAITRVTNLIHRYNRNQGVYTLEMNLGEVTTDFGLPEWAAEPLPSVPPVGPPKPAEFIGPLQPIYMGPPAPGQEVVPKPLHVFPSPELLRTLDIQKTELRIAELNKILEKPATVQIGNYARIQLRQEKQYLEWLKAQ